MSAIRITFAAAALLTVSAPAWTAESPPQAMNTPVYHSAQGQAMALVTAIGDVRRGSMVTIEGTVERILDTDEFLIADATGRIRVDVGYPNFVPVGEGETIRVVGFVDRDLIREVYAREIVHADGRVTRLHRNYED